MARRNRDYGQGSPSGHPGYGYGRFYADWPHYSWPNDRSGWTPDRGYAGDPGHPGYGYGVNWTQVDTGNLSDQDIEDRIYNAIDNDFQIPESAEITVEVNHGVVTLTGKVRGRRTKIAAGNDAWSTPGVHDVHNIITVAGRRRARPGPHQGQPAEEGSPAPAQ